MINAPQLLSDLTRLLKRLEGDLLQRIEEVPELKTSLQAEWQAARDAERCAETFETWADQVITQAGVHWLLSCVFLRFIEDNQLVDRPWLGGTPESGRLALVRDRHDAYFQTHPLENDRDYLLAAFREAGTLPGLRTIFDETHHPAFRLGISGDAAMALMKFWWEVDADTGALKHDFTDPAWNTRFLGDLYQDLSEATRKRYALLQTPEFVEEFILDRTLTPAIREFGFREARLIDPTCGSGHFLLGGFRRLLLEWQRNEPGRNPVDIAQKALDAVAGVDLNPFAVAISRFRLFVAALQASGVQRLANAHDFKVSVAIGDSLLHGTRFGLTQSQDLFDAAESHADTGLAHAYASEDLAEVQRILGRQYHAVVGNPPYIVVKDAALNAAYRRKYASCHMKYSLGAPFTERFFELAVTAGADHSAGYVGLITANSFMKREFGSKLIEHVLPRLDLTHVVDTSGAYIPGHATPTAILFGRHRPPVASVVRLVMGINGEPLVPEDASEGHVWSAILGQIDSPGSSGLYISVSDTQRESLRIHPWSIGGGGVGDLKEAIEGKASGSLIDECTGIGFFGISAANEIMLADSGSFLRHGVEPVLLRPQIAGDEVRDWVAVSASDVVLPYQSGALVEIDAYRGLKRWMWRGKTALWARATFSKRTYRDEGRAWWEWHQLAVERVNADLCIAFAELATHNNFVLGRGGMAFNHSAPVLTLREGSKESDYLGLLGLLNSSTACFWFKQVCFNKGNGGIGGGISNEKWELRYVHNSSQVGQFPVVSGRPVEIACQLEATARGYEHFFPANVLKCRDQRSLNTTEQLASARIGFDGSAGQMIALQDELDWEVYGLYGLAQSDNIVFPSKDELPKIRLGERAFEIVLARRVAAGKEQTTWFERHGSTPITEIPAHWPESYRSVVASRIELIERDKSIGLIERPEFKRRWNSPRWEELEHAALRDWLLTRLEASALWPGSTDKPPQLNSTSRLADVMSRDADFMEIAALYAGHADFDLMQLVAELVAAEVVPALPVQRYTDTGLRKRAQWQDTWTAQRREDAGDNVGKIPVPPKYQSKDFLKADFWRLRGGLDVPKERWISYPGCERGSDGSLVIAWAGWNHLQQATALAGYYMDMKDSEGWEPARLQPLLASLLELVPWLEQWHNELDPVFGERMGDYYRGFVAEEARALGFTQDDLRAWKPAATAAKRGRKKKEAA